MWCLWTRFSGGLGSEQLNLIISDILSDKQFCNSNPFHQSGFHPHPNFISPLPLHLLLLPGGLAFPYRSLKGLCSVGDWKDKPNSSPEIGR